MDQYKPTGAEGQGIGIYNVVESEIKLSKAFEKLNNNHNKYNQKKLMDEDEVIRARQQLVVRLLRL